MNHAPHALLAHPAPLPHDHENPLGTAALLLVFFAFASFAVWRVMRSRNAQRSTSKSDV